MRLPKLKQTYGSISGMLSIKNPPEQLKQDILNAFVFENPAYIRAARFSPWGPPKCIEQYISLAEYANGVLRFPRGILPHAQLTELGRQQFRRIKWVDKTTSFKTSFPPLKVTLNAEQLALVKATTDPGTARAHPFRSMLLVAPTGVGKTISQAVIASKFGERTLVLCLTNLIKKAWVSDLAVAFGLNPKEIGLIQQSTWRIGKQFTLASVQTLAKRKERWPELFKQIGCLIVDEADTISAASIHNFVMACPARYVIGATATHVRRNNNAHLSSIFGTYVKRLISTQKDTATSMALQDVSLLSTGFRYVYQPMNLNYNDLQDKMMQDEDRNWYICSNVLDDWKKGHCVLISTNRVAHVHVLADMLKEMGVKHVRSLTGETNVSKTYTEELLADIFSRKCRCVVASRTAILRGANVNPLDVLHVTMPSNREDLEQLVGRIRRKYPKKRHCLVRYYLDKGVPYLFNVFKREALPCFRKLRVKRFENFYMA